MAQNLLTFVMSESRLSGGSSAPDAVLLERAVQFKEKAAFTFLVQRHGPMVWAVCRNTLVQEQDAEDAFQATFLALLQRGSSIRGRASLAAWLHSVALRVCLKARRSAVRCRKREQATARPEAMDECHETWQADLVHAHAAIQRLPRREREVFVLCVLEGARQSEAARRLGIKLNTLSGFLARARKRLQAYQIPKDLHKPLALALVASCPAAAPAALIRQTCLQVGSTASVGQSVLFLAASVTEVTMRKLVFLTMLTLLLGTGVTVGTAWIGKAAAQFPQAPANGLSSLQGYYNGQFKAGSSAHSTNSAPPITKWEYKTLRCIAQELEPQANALGEKGWELCSSQTMAQSAQVLCVFKRTVQLGEHRIFSQGSFTSNQDDAGPRNPEYFSIELQRGNATEVAILLRDLFKQIVVIPDARTNTLHLQAVKQEMKNIRQAVESMDRASANKPATPVKR